MRWASILALGVIASTAHADDETRVLELLEGGADTVPGDDVLEMVAAMSGAEHTHGHAPGVDHPSVNLQRGQPLPANPGYIVRDPNRAWGTASTVAWFTGAFDEMKRDAAAPAVMVHDLSTEHGGPLSGHRSHQGGRDVDLMYYRSSCGAVCGPERVTATELDAQRQWRLLRYWLERDEAEFIFIDYALQAPLYRAAQTSGATARELARWFQFPAPRSARTGIIRHVDGHANHLHVRFRCVPAEHSCGRARGGRAAPTMHPSSRSSKMKQNRTIWGTRSQL